MTGNQQVPSLNIRTNQALFYIKCMLALESRCIPVVKGGTPMFWNVVLPLKNKQEHPDVKYILVLKHNYYHSLTILSSA